MTKMQRLLTCLKERLAPVLCILYLISFAAIGFVYAKYVQDVDTDVPVNVTVTGDIEIEILEKAPGTYSIRHAAGSTAPAYVRFAVVVNWADGDGNLYYTQPKDYTVTAENCSVIGQYYYYNGYLPVGEVIDHIAVTLNHGASAPAEYPNFRVQILAEGIQCRPEGVAEAAWGAAFNGTVWSKVTP